MKLVTPEISWHNRDPIYSADLQYMDGHVTRMVTSGTDKTIRVWSVSECKEGKVNVEFLANLDRHSRPVNVVRFSPDGELLASAGDDSVIMLWKLQAGSNQQGATLFNEDNDEVNNKETWTVQKILRGHLEDIYDLAWSPDGSQMVTGSVDNSAIIWDVKKGRPSAFLKESSSFIQGVAWDPKNQYVATLSCDRRCRIYSVATQQILHTVHKMTLPSQPSNDNGESVKPKPFKMFHDDTMKSFFRRPHFSPDGEILITPAGLVELGEKDKNDDVMIKDEVIVKEKDSKESKSEVNATFLFSRAKMTRPAAYLPYPPKATVAVRCSPVLYQLREIPRKDLPVGADPDNLKPWEKYQSLFCLPYRVVFAVATEDSVLIYDSQQTLPLASITKIHYHQLSDLAWSSDARLLVIASTDGYCSIVSFDENELGEIYQQTEKSSDEISVEKSISILEPEVKSPDILPQSVPEKFSSESMDLHLELYPSGDEMDTAPPVVISGTSETHKDNKQTLSPAAKLENEDSKTDDRQPRRITFTTITKKS